jgi:hypothetical protein
MAIPFPTAVEELLQDRTTSCDVIKREHHAKHPKTRFVNAHLAMLYYDMDKVAALLDKYPTPMSKSPPPFRTWAVRH